MLLYKSEYNFCLVAAGVQTEGVLREKTDFFLQKFPPCRRS